jgi:hypothetical protein
VGTGGSIRGDVALKGASARRGVAGVVKGKSEFAPVAAFFVVMAAMAVSPRSCCGLV